MPVINPHYKKTKKINFTNVYTDIQPEHNTDVLPLNYYAMNLQTAEIGNKYALFAGGTYRVDGASTGRTNIRAYNAELTRSSCALLPSATQISIWDSKGGTSIGDTYAIFCRLYGNSGKQGVAYNESLTQISIDDGDNKSPNAGYASIGDMYGAVIGYTGEAYDTSLTKHSISGVSSGFCPAGASIKGTKFAVFAGSCCNISGKSVLTVDTSLTTVSKAELPSNVRYMHGVSLGDYYAVFASKNLVVAYDSSLTMTVMPSFSTTREHFGAASSTKSYVLFAGGGTGKVEVYDLSLTNTTYNAPDLQISRTYLRGASVGLSYALFAGGGGADAGPVDAYSLVPTYFLDITIPAMSKYKFNDETEQSTRMSPVSKHYERLNEAISGYIEIHGNNEISGDLRI